jgi:hypothetical protein
MGPQLISCGNRKGKEATMAHTHASMGPQLISCGNAALFCPSLKPLFLTYLREASPPGNPVAGADPIHPAAPTSTWPFPQRAPLAVPLLLHLSQGALRTQAAFVQPKPLIASLSRIKLTVIRRAVQDRCLSAEVVREQLPRLRQHLGNISHQ